MEFEYIVGMFIDVARIAAFGVEDRGVKLVMVGGATIILHPSDANSVMETIKIALTKRGAVFLS